MATNPAGRPCYHADPLCIPILYRAILRNPHLPFTAHTPSPEPFNSSSFVEANWPPETCPVTQFFTRIFPGTAWLQSLLATGHKLILLGPGEDLSQVPGMPEKATVSGSANSHRARSSSRLTILCMGPDGCVVPLDETVMLFDVLLDSSTGATLSGNASTYVAPIVDLLSHEAYGNLDFDGKFMMAQHDHRDLSLLETMRRREEKYARKRAHRELKRALPTLPLPMPDRTIIVAPNPGTVADSSADAERDQESFQETGKLYMPNNTNGGGTRRTVEHEHARNVKPAYRGVKIREVYPCLQWPSKDQTTTQPQGKTWGLQLAFALSFENLREPLWMDYDSYLPWLGWRRTPQQPEQKKQAKDHDSNAEEFEVVPPVEKKAQTAYAMLEQGRCVVGLAVAEEKWDWGGAENDDCLVVSTTCTLEADDHRSMSGLIYKTTPERRTGRHLFFHLRGISVAGE